MSIFLNLLRSVLLTIVFAFITPIVLIGSLLATLYLVSYFPGLETVGYVGVTIMKHFLTVFGAGYPLQGILTIGITSGLVGGLFDVCNYYRYQSLGGN